MSAALFATLPVPAPLTRRLAASTARMLAAPGMPAFDFAAPAGEQALSAPDSVSWRVFKNPIATFIGGVAAVILELAEPRVRTGVWEHSRFRVDPVGRMQRTGLAALATVYGPQSKARELIARVVRIHARVEGRTPDGRAYRASDPELLVWVKATAAFGFAEAYARFVRPLDDADLDRFHAEGALASTLYGATAAPRSLAELDTLFDDFAPLLEPSPVVHDFLTLVRCAPIPSRLIRPIQRLLVRAAVDLTPPPIKARLGLEGQGLRPGEAALVRLAGAAADRVVVPTHPAVVSCLRLNLPADHLYRA